MKDRTLQLFRAASRNAHRAPGMDRAPAGQAPQWMRIVNAHEGEDEATVYIYGQITPFAWFGEEVSASQILSELEGITASTIRVRLKSEGGSVFDGVAIYNLLREHKARVVVHVDSLAASIASVIAMAGDEIVISEAASMMIHKPSTVIWGDADELRHEADILDTIEEQIVSVYLRRTGVDAAQLTAWLKEEKWFSGSAAVEAGFADRVAEDGERAPAEAPEDFANFAAPVRKLQVRQEESPERQKEGVEGAVVPLALRVARAAVLKLTHQEK